MPPLKHLCCGFFHFFKIMTRQGHFCFCLPPLCGTGETHHALHSGNLMLSSYYPHVVHMITPCQIKSFLWNQYIRTSNIVILNLVVKPNYTRPTD